MPSGPRGRTWRRIRPVLIPLAALSVFVSCATANVQQTRKAPIMVSSEDAVAIVLDHFWYPPDSDRMGERLAECVVAATTRNAPGVRVLSPADFRNAVFPEFEPAAVPGTPETVALLLDHPEFRSRLESHGIRYLVLLRGGTRAIRHGRIECGSGYQWWDGGCYGAYWWDKTTDLQAFIMDTRGEAVSSEIAATANGRPWVAIVYVVPFGIPVSTEYPACQAVGESIASHLSGGAPGQPVDESPGPARESRE